MSNDNSTFGTSVLLLREEKKIGLRKFTQMTGMSPRYLSKVERDEERVAEEHRHTEDELHQHHAFKLLLCGARLLEGEARRQRKKGLFLQYLVRAAGWEVRNIQMKRQLARASILGLALWIGAAAAQDEAAPAPKVSVVAAFTRMITEEKVFLGRVEAVDKVDVIARVDGYIREPLIVDGQEVMTDDVLFEIEDDQYRTVVSAREADLARAKANFALARVELDRIRQVVERKAVPRSKLDIAIANEAVAESEIAAAEAALDQAKLNLSYTQVTAPFSGRVGRLRAASGRSSVRAPDRLSRWCANARFT